MFKYELEVKYMEQIASNEYTERITFCCNSEKEAMEVIAVCKKCLLNYKGVGAITATYEPDEEEEE